MTLFVVDNLAHKSVRVGNMINNVTTSVSEKINSENDTIEHNFRDQPTLSKLYLTGSTWSVVPIPSKAAKTDRNNPRLVSVNNVNCANGSEQANQVRRRKRQDRTEKKADSSELERAAKEAIAKIAPRTLEDIERFLAYCVNMQRPRHFMTLRTLHDLLQKHDLENEKTAIRPILDAGELTDSHSIEVLEVLLIMRNGLERLAQNETVTEVCRGLGIRTHSSKRFLYKYVIEFLAWKMLAQNTTCVEISRMFGIEDSNDLLALDTKAYQRVGPLLDAGTPCWEIYQILGFTHCFCSYERIEIEAVEKRAPALIDKLMEKREIMEMLGISEPEAEDRLDTMIENKHQERLRSSPAQAERNVAVVWYMAGLGYLNQLRQWFASRFSW